MNLIDKRMLWHACCQGLYSLRETSFQFTAAYVGLFQHHRYTLLVTFAGMTVLYAYYGLSCAKGNVQKSNQDRSTKYVKHLCDGKNSCSGYVHTSILTDPYHGCEKDFLVVAQCPGGEIISSHLTPEAQGKTFRLTCQCQCA